MFYSVNDKNGYLLTMITFNRAVETTLKIYKFYSHIQYKVQDYRRASPSMNCPVSSYRLGYDVCDVFVVAFKIGKHFIYENSGLTACY